MVADFLDPKKLRKNSKSKGQIKGQTVLKLNLHISLTYMGSFECARPDFATVSKFQDKKTKKATTISQISTLYSRNFFGLNEVRAHYL